MSEERTPEEIAKIKADNEKLFARQQRNHNIAILFFLATILIGSALPFVFIHFFEAQDVNDHMERGSAEAWETMQDGFTFLYSDKKLREAALIAFEDYTTSSVKDMLNDPLGKRRWSAYRAEEILEIYPELDTPKSRELVQVTHALYRVPDWNWAMQNTDRIENPELRLTVMQDIIAYAAVYMRETDRFNKDDIEFLAVHHPQADSETWEVLMSKVFSYYKTRYNTYKDPFCYLLTATFARNVGLSQEQIDTWTIEGLRKLLGWEMGSEKILDFLSAAAKEGIAIPFDQQAYDKAMEMERYQIAAILAKQGSEEELFNAAVLKLIEQKNDSLAGVYEVDLTTGTVTQKFVVDLGFSQ